MRTAEYLRGLAKRVRENRIIVEQEVATDGDVTLEAFDVEMYRRNGNYCIDATADVKYAGCRYKSIQAPVLANALEDLDFWTDMEIDL